MEYPKRLIEVDLPIARISAHARREKSIRHGHISTLHIWWARRPLAACRSVICAALWPDPADPLCPQSFRDAAAEHIIAFANRIFPERITTESRELQKTAPEESLRHWQELIEAQKSGKPINPGNADDQRVLRERLLDLIADFANWDNSTVPAYLETSRALTQSAHEALGGAPGTRPLVVDPFAGGGSIPLETLRVGADSFASDLNPVAVLLNKVVLQYMPKHGQRLVDGVRKWGQWVKEQAEQELAEFYPKDPDGATPIAYLWARTILSEAPGQGEIPVEVPMLRSMWLAKRSANDRAMRFVIKDDGSVAARTVHVAYADGRSRTVRQPVLEIFQPSRASEVPAGTVQRGAVTCPVTGYTTPLASVKSQLIPRKGGTNDARLIAIRYDDSKTGRRAWRLPLESDLEAVRNAYNKLAAKKSDHQGDLSLVPDESTIEYHTFVNRGPIYGMTSWECFFTPRQSLALSTIYSVIRRTPIPSDDHGLARAVRTCLALSLDRLVDFNSSLCVLNTVGGRGVLHTFARQALPMVWDFMETNPFNEAGASWTASLKAFDLTLNRESCIENVGNTDVASATALPLPDDSANALVTDPPYYYSIQYADLSDFFYVWLKRTLESVEPSIDGKGLTPKNDEIIVQSPGHQYSAEGKNAEFFESRMHQALSDARRVVAPSGVAVVVFAHTSTSGWEALLEALITAGWTVTGSWPIDTERAGRTIALDRSVLASSVHLACRPREMADGSLREEIGEWRDVLSELPKRIHEWMPRLAAEGVVGADAIFACLGPALEIFSRYSCVEKASGEVVPLREYLEQVWAAVSTEALSMIFKDADAASLEPDARLTAMWLWTLGVEATNGNDVEVTDGPSATAKSTGYTLEFDAARKIAQGLGVHLEDIGSVVEIKGDKARLLPVNDRVKHLFGKEEDVGGKKKAKKKPVQRSLFEELDEAESGDTGWVAVGGPTLGETVLDRIHQAMILFAGGRSEAMKRFLVEDGAGTDGRFWKLSQSLSALYPPGSEEKRWVDGVLARKKGLGL